MCSFVVEDILAHSLSNAPLPQPMPPMTHVDIEKTEAAASVAAFAADAYRSGRKSPADLPIHWFTPHK
jgi:hypothetical protein